MDILSTLQQVIGSGDTQSVADAASDHVSEMSGDDVEQHLQTAADNAATNGKPDVAQELGNLISQAQSDPEALKAGAISYVKDHPEVLAHFAPAFAQGILARL